MAELNLHNIFQFLDLTLKYDKDIIQVENETIFKLSLKFFELMSSVLNAFKKQRQGCLTGNDITNILKAVNIGEGENVSTSLDIISVISIFHGYVSEKTDLNGSILKLFNDSLLYLTVLIHNESEMVNVIFSNFLEMKQIIFTFSNAEVLLESKCFKSSVILFITDLIRILTSNQVSAENSKKIKLLSVISKILTELAQLSVYRDVIIEEIFKRLRNLLSYYKANEDFDGLNSSTISALEHLLHIIRSIFTAASCLEDMDCGLRNQVKQTLRDLQKILDNKIRSIFRLALDDIIII